MTKDLNSAMRRATQLVRSGNLQAATDAIQKSLAPHTTGPSQSAAQHASPLKLGGLGLQRPRVSKGAVHKTWTKSGAISGTKPVVPAGARFEEHSFSCAAGSRDYKIYVPNLGATPPKGMLVMLHGCTQTPDDFANGTGMNQIADEHGLIVLYPAQSRGANMQSCWNWFGPADQERGSGEPAILAKLTLEMRDSYKLPHDKVFVAGLSAGAAMAVILGRTYPDNFAAVGAHSGLPYKAARDVPSAFAAMGSGATTTHSCDNTTIPTIIFHGDADNTVNTSNGKRIAQDATAKGGTELIEDGKSNGREYTRVTVLAPDGQPNMEHWQIKGQGHAWSGGHATGSYTDTQGPRASAEMVRFFLGLS